MVFNWFRRQFTDPSQTSPAEVEPPQPEVEAAPPEAAPEAAAAETAPPQEDYLNWAKLAYQNIQKRQQAEQATQTGAAPEAQTETTPAPAATAAPETTATVPAPPAPETVPAPVAPETEVVASEVIPTEATATAEVELEAAATAPPSPETLMTPVAEIPAETATEILNLPPEVLTPEAETQTQEPPLSPEPIAPVSEAAAPEPAVAIAPEVVPEPTPASEPVVAAIAAEPVPEPTAESVPNAEAAAPTSPQPFWARAEAERQERLERLRATAIVEPEPEPQPPTTPEPAVATVEPEALVEMPGLAFDEGFLWSAEVLAAQGRRPEDISVEEITWLQKLRQGLGKTRRSLINQLKAIVGQGPLNQDAVTEIEALLLQADVGVEATDEIIAALQNQLRQEALPPDAAITYLKTILRELLDRPIRETYRPTFAPEKGTLNVWLIAGVNGAGKTTTIGKIAHIAQQSGYNCLIAAADTFRAAAVEQVKIWGQRAQVEVIANPGQNTDPAAVVFDAIAAAQARDTELLLVDTAGRLQNKKNLMEELRKIRRIIDKKVPGAKIESLLVLDATLGQNGLRQAEVFSEAAQLTGVVLTKLDGTAKGGVALAVVQQLGLPIRFIGAGEGIEDLRPFSSYEFVEALLS